MAQPQLQRLKRQGLQPKATEPLNEWFTTGLSKVGLTGFSAIASVVYQSTHCTNKCVARVFFLLNISILFSVALFQFVVAGQVYFYNDGRILAFSIFVACCQFTLAAILTWMYTLDEKQGQFKRMRISNIVSMVVNILAFMGLWINHLLATNERVRGYAQIIPSERAKRWILPQPRSQQQQLGKVEYQEVQQHEEDL